MIYDNNTNGNADTNFLHLNLMTVMMTILTASKTLYFVVLVVRTIFQ